jgi:hypothetical protein
MLNKVQFISFIQELSKPKFEIDISSLPCLLLAKDVIKDRQIFNLLLIYQYLV